MLPFRMLSFSLWSVLGLAGCGSKVGKPAEAPEGRMQVLPAGATQSGGLADTEWGPTARPLST
jgi:hypothetical protein